MMPRSLSPAKIKARGKKFREAFASAEKAIYLRIEALMAEIDQIRQNAVSLVPSLDVIAFALPSGLFGQIFEGACGIVLFYSTGMVYYAPRPIQI